MCMYCVHSKKKKRRINFDFHHLHSGTLYQNILYQDVSNDNWIDRCSFFFFFVAVHARALCCVCAGVCAVCAVWTMDATLMCVCAFCVFGVVYCALCVLCIHWMLHVHVCSVLCCVCTVQCVLWACTMCGSVWNECLLFVPCKKYERTYVGVGVMCALCITFFPLLFHLSHLLQGCEGERLEYLQSGRTPLHIAHHVCRDGLSTSQVSTLVAIVHKQVLISSKQYCTLSHAYLLFYCSLTLYRGHEMAFAPNYFAYDTIWQSYCFSLYPVRHKPKIMTYAHWAEKELVHHARTRTSVLVISVSAPLVFQISSWLYEFVSVVNGKILIDAQQIKQIITLLNYLLCLFCLSIITFTPSPSMWASGHI